MKYVDAFRFKWALEGVAKFQNQDHLHKVLRHIFFKFCSASFYINWDMIIHTDRQIDKLIFYSQSFARLCLIAYTL